MMQRRPRRENKKHLKWLMERPCVICGNNLMVDACHIKMADGRVNKPQSSNIGMKADDRFTLPMCRMHHDSSHSMPERVWWKGQGFDPVLLALTLYSITGDSEAADDLILTQIWARQEIRKA